MVERYLDTVEGIGSSPIECTNLIGYVNSYFYASSTLVKSVKGFRVYDTFAISDYMHP